MRRFSFDKKNKHRTLVEPAVLAARGWGLRAQQIGALNAYTPKRRCRRAIPVPTLVVDTPRNRASSSTTRTVERGLRCSDVWLLESQYMAGYFFVSFRLFDVFSWRITSKFCKRYELDLFVSDTTTTNKEFQSVRSTTLHGEGDLETHNRDRQRLALKGHC